MVNWWRCLLSRVYPRRFTVAPTCTHSDNNRPVGGSVGCLAQGHSALRSPNRQPSGWRTTLFPHHKSKRWTHATVLVGRGGDLCCFKRTHHRPCHVYYIEMMLWWIEQWGFYWFLLWGETDLWAWFFSTWMFIFCPHCRKSESCFINKQSKVVIGVLLMCTLLEHIMKH